MIVKEYKNKGLTCIIRRLDKSLSFDSYPCGYVEIPKEYWNQVKKAANNGEFEANGDITFIGELPEGERGRLCIGFDMAHSWDGHYEADRWVCDRTELECERETNFLAKQVRRFIDDCERNK